MPTFHDNGGHARNIALILRPARPLAKKDVDDILLCLFGAFDAHPSLLPLRPHVELVHSNPHEKLPDDEAEKDSDEGAGEDCNDLTIAIRPNDEWARCRTLERGLLLPSHGRCIAASVVREALAVSTWPEVVIEVGVSTICEREMCLLWAEIIRTCNGGGGYQRHPMWRYWPQITPSSSWGSWDAVREWSYRFSWPGYAHEMAENEDEV